MKSFTEVLKENKTKKQFLTLAEAAYAGNIGFEEMVKFYKQATKADEDAMEKILKRNDIKAFKRLISKVLGIDLK